MTERLRGETRDYGRSPEIRSGQEVSSTVEAIYENVSKRLASVLVESNAVLSLAGVKPTADLRIPTEIESGENDVEVIEAVRKANEILAKRSPEVRLRSSGKCHESRIGRLVEISPQNLSALERVTKQTKIPGVPVFDRLAGFNGLSDWHRQLYEGLGEAQNNGKLPVGEAVLDMVTEGILLGYPDQAIYDFIDWYTSEKDRRELQSAAISHVGTYREAQPVYDFYPEHADDPAIQQNIKISGQILTDFYESSWHKDLSTDSEFLRLRSNRNKRK